jgi:hypothetical protein
MPKKKKTSKEQKAQVKVRDLKAKKDARGGYGQKYSIITGGNEPGTLK